MPDRTLPLEGQVLRHSELRGISSGPEGLDREQPVKGADEATVITSEVEGSAMHKVVLDIDMPVKAIESSTPGHYHLFIDKELDWSDYSRLLWVLADIGIIEEGYASSSAERGYTAVRLPWIKKITNTLKQMVGRVMVNGVEVGADDITFHRAPLGDPARIMPPLERINIEEMIAPAAPPPFNEYYRRPWL